MTTENGVAPADIMDRRRPSEMTEESDTLEDHAHSTERVAAGEAHARHASASLDNLSALHWNLLHEGCCASSELDLTTSRANLLNFFHQANEQRRENPDAAEIRQTLQLLQYEMKCMDWADGRQGVTVPST